MLLTILILGNASIAFLNGSFHFYMVAWNWLDKRRKHLFSQIEDKCSSVFSYCFLKSMCLLVLWFRVIALTPM